MAVRAYAKASDITALGISLTNQQSEATEVLLPTASAKLRNIAKRYSMDLDEMVDSDEDYSEIVKNVVIQSVVRAINAISDNTPALSQGSETNGSYSISMTYLNAGQSLYFLRNELKELGLKRQVYGALELYGTEE